MRFILIIGLELLWHRNQSEMLQKTVRTGVWADRYGELNKVDQRMIWSIQNRFHRRLHNMPAGYKCAQRDADKDCKHLKKIIPNKGYLHCNEYHEKIRISVVSFGNTENETISIYRRVIYIFSWIQDQGILNFRHWNC